MLKVFVLLSVIQAIYGSPINGNKITYAKQSEGPWTVLLVIRGNRCTGSLINKKYVITAAHCFDELEDYKSLENDVKIFIGEWKTGQDHDCSDYDQENEDYEDEDVCFPEKVAEIPPKRLTIHSEYLRKKRAGAPDKNTHDVAIIELKRPPRESKIVKSIQLPDPDTCEDDLEEPILITGFGEVKPKHYANTKKKNFIKLDDQGTCKRKLGKPFNEEKHFCGLGANNVATCKGDSGGPAANKVNGVYTLQGIVSFGASECGHGDTPSGFVRVACFIDWIDEHTGGQPRTTTTTRRTTTGRISTRTTTRKVTRPLPTTTTTKKPKPTTTTTAAEPGEGDGSIFD